MSSQPSDNTNSSRFLFDLFEYWRVADYEMYRRLLRLQLQCRKATEALLSIIPTHFQYFPKKTLDSLLDHRKKQGELAAHLKQLAQSLPPTIISPEITNWTPGTSLMDVVIMMSQIAFLLGALRIVQVTICWGLYQLREPDRRKKRHIRKGWRGLVDILRGGGSGSLDLRYTDSQMDTLINIANALLINPDIITDTRSLTLLWDKLTSMREECLITIESDLARLENYVKIQNLQSQSKPSKRERLKSFSTAVYHKQSNNLLKNRLYNKSNYRII